MWCNSILQNFVLFSPNWGPTTRQPTTRTLLATNGGLPILTPMINNPIYWLSHFHMVRIEQSSARCYCTTYEFGEQQGRINIRGIWNLLAVVEQQGRSNPHGIWTLFSVGEYANWLTYTQFSGCVPLIWGDCFGLLVGTCESTLRSCESPLSLCESNLSMR